MDLDALLAARESDGASGENLEYDPDFTELQRVAAPGEERQAGKEIIAGEEPDFKDVESRALAILQRSHDLRAAVLLANARLNTKGLVGFADAVSYMRRCLEERWDTCHPELDAEDDNDPTMRINALALSGTKDSPSLLLKYLRAAPLTQSRTFGRLCLRDIQFAYGEAPAPANVKPLAKSEISAAFVDTPEDVVTANLNAARQVQADMKAIEGVFSDQTPGQGPDLTEVRKMVQQIVRHLSGHAVAEAAPEEEAADEETDADAGAAPAPRRGGGGGGGVPGNVETAGDARAAIDRVIDYFKRYEPSSPVPIILERAKRLVGADFMTIMKDMAPDGLSSVRTIGGITDDDD